MYIIVLGLLIIIAMLLAVLYNYGYTYTYKNTNTTPSIHIKKDIVRYNYKPSQDQLKYFIKDNTGPYTDCLVYINKDWSSRDNWYLLCNNKYYAPTGLLHVQNGICTIEGRPKDDVYIKRLNTLDISSELIKIT
jgi:hypothetical protein